MLDSVLPVIQGDYGYLKDAREEPVMNQSRLKKNRISSNPEKKKKKKRKKKKKEEKEEEKLRNGKNEEK